MFWDDLWIELVKHPDIVERTYAWWFRQRPWWDSVVVFANYYDLVGGADIAPKKTAPASGSFDFIHLFVRDTAALARDLPRLEPRLAAGGMIWVSWPKKTSPLFKDLTEDGVRKVCLPLDWVDVKVCAVDADWSGLKLLRRKKA
jgi:hypothetical protein